MRAQCDAVEIADLLLGRAPLPLSAHEQIARLRFWQDPHSGIVGALDEDGRQRPVGTPPPFSKETGYHFLCVGYALDLLGSEFAHPPHGAAALSADDVVEYLEALPWQENPWYSGDWADTLGTAIMWNRRQEVREQSGALDALFGWLLTHADPHTGLWGEPSATDATDGLMRVVNGFYRASRGTFAQFGLPVPYPERTIDSVLQHARDARYTRRDRQTACNILDIAHPLWLTRTTGYRADEVVTLARQLLADALQHWVEGVPNRSRTTVITSSYSRAEETSRRAATTSAPRASIRWDRSRWGPSATSVITSRAPSRAKSSTIAVPRPPVPPVISVTLPSSRCRVMDMVLDSR